jgi:tetratricopeptide (TPR) repeat protein
LVLMLVLTTFACGGRQEEPHPAGEPAAAGGAPVSAPPSNAARAAPPKLEPRLLEAFRAIKAGRYDEARGQVDVYLRSADAKHPGHAAFVRGLSYHEQQLYETARPSFARALELEPDFFTTYFFYGFTLFNLGRLDEAKQALESYLSHMPDEAEAVFGLGLVALEQDRIDDAEKSFKRAIAIAESKPRTGKKAASLDEDLARYQARLGDAYLRRDDLPDARAAFERSVALWPAHGEPWHKLACVLQRLGDTAGAEAAQARSTEALERRAVEGKRQP